MHFLPLSSCKNFPPYFFMVHLLHRLYGVDAPANRTVLSDCLLVSGVARKWHD